MEPNGSAPQNAAVPAKALLSMAPCLLCLYVNAVMLLSLARSPALLQSARYLLFGHLLLADSLHLLMCGVLYLVAVGQARLGSGACMLLLMAGEAVAMASPLTLAVMSLERYVAIRLPLRHARISTRRRTGAAAAAVWCVAALDPLSQGVSYLALRRRHFTMQSFCLRSALLARGPFSAIKTAFVAVLFVLIGGVILCTYVFILMAARHAAAAAASGAGRARGTVLLHMLQLCLCLTSTTFNMMSAALPAGRAQATLHGRYLLFLCLIILPRFLSPLVYGLRDHAFRRRFKHYFLFGLRTHRKPLVYGQ